MRDKKYKSVEKPYLIQLGDMIISHHSVGIYQIKGIVSKATKNFVYIEDDEFGTIKFSRFYDEGFHRVPKKENKNKRYIVLKHEKKE